jgi:Cu/Ag efflux protein CusF
MNQNGWEWIKNMKRNITAAAFALSLSLLPAVSFAENPTVKGEVKKIDESAGKITLKHGPIKNLGMDDENMTMVFHVQDPAMLKQVKTGDKVQFEADTVNGQMTVTKIQKAK